MTSEPAASIAAPLLLTEDAALEGEVRRLAAAAGVGLQRNHDLTSLGPQWSRAPVVLIGADVIPDVAACMPERRRDVHVLAPGPASAEIFRQALVVGAESVTELPKGSDWLVELLTDASDGAESPATVIGVIGAGGGAGASTLTVALGFEAGRDHSCLVVDLDPVGGGVEQIAGMHHHDGIRWEDIGATGRLGGRSLRESLPTAGRLAVLGFGSGATELPDTAVVRETMSAARRGFDLVFVDLGRHPTPAREALRARCDHLFVVTTLAVTSLAAATRLRRCLPDTGCSLVARGTERGVDVGVLADVLDLPVSAHMRDQPGLDEAIVLGAGPTYRERGPLARAARDLLANLPRTQP